MRARLVHRKRLKRDLRAGRLDHIGHSEEQALLDLEKVVPVGCAHIRKHVDLQGIRAETEKPHAHRLSFNRWVLDEEASDAVDDDPDELHALLDRIVADCDAHLDRALATRGVDTVAERRHPRTGEGLSLRWILLHMIEEYARHNGHADLLREAVDGSTGS